MSCQEEQLQELEVVEAIYPDEFYAINSEYPDIQFRVDLKLDLIPLNTSSFTEKSIEFEQHIVIEFLLPETYPDVVPKLKIEPYKVSLKDGEEIDGEEEEELGFDEQGNPITAKLENIPDMIDFDDYIPELIEALLAQVESDMLVGAPMCFGLISSAKENCETWFQNTLQALELAHEQKLREREMEEQKKFQGTKVTKESYLEWRKNFRRDFGLDERDARRRMEAHSGRLSGRQVFEQGLAGAEDDEVAAVEDELSQGIKQL
ncbi:HBR058Cp [Eremothecium sinecaudum]|uniref:HBR058Cp n=1 Tax=Eremothecium sinecaudum TaxID=45286 RepID=A0A120K129_9SACH|nr:HBR058Cp [Eremothecium sinecaudum]AMD18959.1 HBR058Cp [Eremothecium sinecaudum]